MELEIKTNKTYKGRWKLRCTDDQNDAGLTFYSLRATIGPLKANRPLFHYVIGISGILPYNRDLTLQTCLSITGGFFRLYSTFARFYKCCRLASLASSLGWLVGNKWMNNNETDRLSRMDNIIKNWMVWSTSCMQKYAVLLLVSWQKSTCGHIITLQHQKSLHLFLKVSKGLWLPHIGYKRKFSRIRLKLKEIEYINWIKSGRLQ